MNSKIRSSRTAIVFFALCASVSFSIRADAREWQDTSGKYSVEASFVAADDELVVLETTDERLLIVRQDQLSPKDREYVAARMDSSDVGSAGRDAGESTGESKRVYHSPWQLRDGDIVEGRLLGFGSQTLVVKRHRGDILVGQRKLQNLPRAYRKILPDVVSQVDKTHVADVEELDAHLADKGGGPFQYVVEGVQLQLQSGDVVTIPVTLLDPQDASQVAPGLARWKAAQGNDVPERDRRVVDNRERLMLDSYGRYRGRHPAAPRQTNFLQLQLLAAEVGVTDVWEVTLYPARSYGYPYTVVVLAQNALIAQQRALRQFPGWRVGATRKISD